MNGNCSLMGSEFHFKYHCSCPALCPPFLLMLNLFHFVKIKKMFSLLNVKVELLIVFE